MTLVYHTWWRDIRLCPPSPGGRATERSPMALDKDVLKEAAAKAGGNYGLRYVDVLELLTDFLGFGDTGIQDSIPDGTTVKDIQEALVELLEKAIGRR